MVKAIRKQSSLESTLAGRAVSTGEKLKTPVRQVRRHVGRPNKIFDVSVVNILDKDQLMNFIQSFINGGQIKWSDVQQLLEKTNQKRIKRVNGKDLPEINKWLFSVLKDSYKLLQKKEIICDLIQAELIPIELKNTKMSFQQRQQFNKQNKKELIAKLDQLTKANSERDDVDKKLKPRHARIWLVARFYQTLLPDGVESNPEFWEETDNLANQFDSQGETQVNILNSNLINKMINSKTFLKCSIFRTKKAWNILELCCGDGKSSTFFMQALLGRKVKIASITLNDFVPTKATAAKERIQKLMDSRSVCGSKVQVEAHSGKMQDLELQQSHYQLIMWYWALIYIQNSKILDFLRKLHSFMTDDGLLVIVENVHDDDDDDSLLGQANQIIDPEFGQVTRSSNYYRYIFSFCGFTVLRIFRQEYNDIPSPTPTTKVDDAEHKSWIGLKGYILQKRRERSNHRLYDEVSRIEPNL